MTNTHSNRLPSRLLIRLVVGMGVVAVASLSMAAPARADDFVLIKNAKNGMAQLPRSEVKNLFTGRTKTWSDAGVVTVVLGAEDTPSTMWLADKIFQVAAKTMLTKIKQEVFKGEMKKPLAAGTPAEAIEQVRNTPGAIAAVPAEAAKALPAGVAVLPLAD
jgi:ABC-type phosphate transport system substrate-binding protein